MATAGRILFEFVP